MKLTTPNDYIKADSSIPKHRDLESFALDNPQDPILKIGTVQSVVEFKGDLLYNVEVWLGGKWTAVQCTRTSRFGGIYNYEEYTHRGFIELGQYGRFDFKAGDHVLIAYVGGSSLTGAIVGCLNHPGRPRKFDKDSDIAYESEFNGLNKSIGRDGDYTVTYKGLQTNIDKLKEKAEDGKEIPAPEYDESIGGSFYRFGVDGSFEVSDNDNQSIFIDKPFGQIVVTSGGTSLTINKDAESYEIVNKSTTITAADSFSLDTKATTINSTDVVDITSTAINTTGELTQTGDVTIEGKTDQTGNVSITGNFENTGTAKLGGGAHPLIYNILLTIGVGNLGAPVVSNNIVLKTVKTKAT
jgi:hypothetical protein